MSLGRKIAKKRDEKDITQENLGERLGVSGAFISQIERGNRSPSYGLLLKISNELDVSVEYLVGGEVEGVTDPTSKVIASALRFVDSDNKKRVLEYLIFLTGSQKYFDYPFFDSPVEYAQYVIKMCKIENPPIDPFAVAKTLNVQIIVSEDDLDYEGILYKSGATPLILLDKSIQHSPRRKFTIAMLLGHLVIPWHLRSTFFREKNQRSLDEEDQLGIEAREFAGALMIPPFMLKQDYKLLTPGLESFEKLAYDKYGTSMLTVGQLYIQSHSKTTALLTWENNKFTRTYNAGFPYTLIEEMKFGSLASSFLEAPPTSKEIRSGLVDPSTWLVNPPPGLKLYEESLLDPSFGVIVTFLQIKR